MKRVPVYPMVRVEWVDACSSPDWVEHRKIRHQAMPSVSVGLLIRETDEHLSLAGIVNRSHVSDVVTIPKGMVTRMAYLQEQP